MRRADRGAFSKDGAQGQPRQFRDGRTVGPSLGDLAQRLKSAQGFRRKALSHQGGVCFPLDLFPFRFLQDRQRIGREDLGGLPPMQFRLSDASDERMCFNPDALHLASLALQSDGSRPDEWVKDSPSPFFLLPLHNLSDPRGRKSCRVPEPPMHRQTPVGRESGRRVLRVALCRTFRRFRRFQRVEQSRLTLRCCFFPHSHLSVYWSALSSCMSEDSILGNSAKYYVRNAVQGEVAQIRPGRPAANTPTTWERRGRAPGGRRRRMRGG